MKKQYENDNPIGIEYCDGCTYKTEKMRCSALAWGPKHRNPLCLNVLKNNKCPGFTKYGSNPVVFQSTKEREKYIIYETTDDYSRLLKNIDELINYPDLDYKHWVSCNEPGKHGYERRFFRESLYAGKMFKKSVSIYIPINECVQEYKKGTLFHTLREIKSYHVSRLNEDIKAQIESCRIKQSFPKKMASWFKRLG